jgi:branched-subunit amino acid transport protein AzlD
VVCRLLLPTPLRLAVLTATLAVSDLGNQLSGGSVVAGGVSDEIAHECTGVLVLWALGRRATRRLLVGVLVGSVLIDVDHVPDYLGFNGLTADTQRPYTHSLLTIAALIVGALLVRSRRDLLLGLTLGTAVHLWRDLSESGAGVSLLWPFSVHSDALPHASYVGIMAVVVAVDAWLCWIAKVKPSAGSLPAAQCHSTPSVDVDRRAT